MDEFLTSLRATEVLRGYSCTQYVWLAMFFFQTQGSGGTAFFYINKHTYFFALHFITDGNFYTALISSV